MYAGGALPGKLQCGQCADGGGDWHHQEPGTFTCMTSCTSYHCKPTAPLGCVACGVATHAQSRVPAYLSAHTTRPSTAGLLGHPQPGVQAGVQQLRRQDGGCSGLLKALMQPQERRFALQLPLGDHRCVEDVNQSSVALLPQVDLAAPGMDIVSTWAPASSMCEVGENCCSDAVFTQACMHRATVCQP